MKLLFVALFLVSILSCLARPGYKDIDYKLFDEESSDALAIDKVYEVVEFPKHHHHHHHKKASKTNRLDRLKRFSVLNDLL
ncbi:hypothetical protein GCK72_000015 [Caenorhabditis remanei]|uniref:Uncharacterized protein n=2 Tax=Caenorhabditis remanei TaxID=31234 RepID=E3MT77_CAERE|nr:hypothetical protein GCK72_000015 [Caenorhabditis remanei]EFP08640.1 hypothetical protein CRE_20414 [Caenorhabditis remanei]KAF1768203.1 hypothetical protein GCK72_000015 [Caenorhabditis remanei]